jgi:hypothetical protein
MNHYQINEDGTAKVLKPKKDIRMCAGCRDNFYNGNNPYGIKQCWNFPSAKVEKRMLIPVDMCPPYDFEPEWVLSCYRPERVCNVKPEAIGKDGYWKA